MITAENDYELIINEQHFTSHIYENQLELLQNYFTTPISSIVPVEQEVNRINTVIKPEKKRSTKLKYKPHLSKYTKRTTKRKSLDISISLRKSKK